MTPSERRDKLATRASMVASLLTVSDCADNLITGWTLTDCDHHLRQLERLVARLNGITKPTEGGPF